MVEMKNETPVIKIEKNIPIPAPGTRGGVYPFGQMEVGDSFLAGLSSQDKLKAASASHWFGKRNSKKFSVLKTDGGFRVWRVA
jgi:hypothetical protein